MDENHLFCMVYWKWRLNRANIVEQSFVIEVTPMDNRIILHSDMNCFYASVEMKVNPLLRNVPLAVAGSLACAEASFWHAMILLKKQA